VQFAVSNYHGPWLVDIVAALVSMGCLVALLRVWRPRTTWRFPEEATAAAAATAAVGAPGGPPREPYAPGAAPVPTHSDAAGGIPTRVSPRAALRAWSPWLILSLFVFLWGLPQAKAVLNAVSAPELRVPGLHGAVLRAPPVVPVAKAEDAIFVFNWLSATGTALLLAGIVSGLLLGVGPARLARLFARTLWRVRWSLLTIAAMLALGFTTRYGGLDATLGLAFASSGALFPFFSPLLGWLGVALTGSDTSSNVLFGNLQQITAQQVGVSPLLAAASNSSGGVMGKMIDAQSIVVAGVATGQHGREGEILRYVFFHSLALAALVGVLVLLQAYVFPGIVP
jgi:lactate permease